MSNQNNYSNGPVRNMSVYVHVQYMQMRYKNEFGIFQVLQKSSEIYLKVYFQDTPRIDIGSQIEKWKCNTSLTLSLSPTIRNEFSLSQYLPIAGR